MTPARPSEEMRLRYGSVDSPIRSTGKRKVWASCSESGLSDRPRYGGQIRLHFDQRASGPNGQRRNQYTVLREDRHDNRLRRAIDAQIHGVRRCFEEWPMGWSENVKLRFWPAAGSVHAQSKIRVAQVVDRKCEQMELVARTA